MGFKQVHFKKKQTKKIKVYKATGWVVFLFALVVLITMIATLFVTDYQTLLPLDTLFWAFAGVTSGYIGVDRVAQFKRTSTLSYGKADLGNNRKMVRIILLTLFLLLSGTYLVIYYGLAIPLDPLASAFGGSSAFYVTGNKAIKAAASTPGYHPGRDKEIEFTDNQSTMVLR